MINFHASMVIESRILASVYRVKEVFVEILFNPILFNKSHMIAPYAPLIVNILC